MSFISKYCIILVLLPAVYTGFFPGKIVIIQTICFYLFTFFYWRKKNKWKTYEFDCKNIYKLLIIWSTITYFRGFFNIDSSQDWANLCSGLFFTCFLFPTILYFPNVSSLRIIIISFFKFGLPLCIITAVFPPSDGFMSFQHNIYFVLPLVFCFTALPYKYKIILVISLLSIVLYNIDRRSCVLNVAIVIAIYLFYTVIHNRFLRLSLNCFFIISPIILLILALTIQFNIFSEISNYRTLQITDSSRSLTTDSRTDIYLDVYEELKDKNAFLFGLGGNGKTRTSLIYNQNQDYSIIYKNGRGRTESGMLNNIQYGGITGLLIFSILFIMASFKATANSNNDFMRMLGAYIAFKYFNSFIEESVNPQGCSFYLYLWIGMCYNKHLRLMNNNMMNLYLTKIFK